MEKATIAAAYRMFPFLFRYVDMEKVDSFSLCLPDDKLTDLFSEVRMENSVTYIRDLFFIRDLFLLDEDGNELVRGLRFRLFRPFSWFRLFAGSENIQEALVRMGEDRHLVFQVLVVEGQPLRAFCNISLYRAPKTSNLAVVMESLLAARRTAVQRLVDVEVARLESQIESVNALANNPKMISDGSGD